MSKFVFIVPPFTGHVNPTLSLGTELIQKGHQVGWISIDESLKTQLPNGGQLLLINYQMKDPVDKDSKRYLDLITQKNVYGLESIKFLYEDVLMPLNKYMFRGISHWLDVYKPDVVINDHQVFSGAIAAYQKNIPYATSVTAPAAIKTLEDLPQIHEWELKKIKFLQQEYGVDEDKSIACSELLTLVFTSKEFFGETNLPDLYKFVGPVIQHRPFMHSFSWDKFHQMRGQPTVLVSIGTTFDHEYKKSFFAKVIEALGDQPVSVVVVSNESLFNQWPGNFLVQNKVPQLELLPYLDAVVCHGGHNTVCETLVHGLPLVVIPIAYDQSYVAGRVVEVGAGIRLNYKRFKAQHLRSAVEDVLKEHKYRSAAKNIQISFEKAGGTQKAGKLLEDIIISKEHKIISV